MATHYNPREFQLEFDFSLSRREGGASSLSDRPVAIADHDTLVRPMPCATACHTHCSLFDCKVRACAKSIDMLHDMRDCLASEDRHFAQVYSRPGHQVFAIGRVDKKAGVRPEVAMMDHVY